MIFPKELVPNTPETLAHDVPLFVVFHKPFAAPEPDAGAVTINAVVPFTAPTSDIKAFEGKLDTKLAFQVDPPLVVTPTYLGYV